MLRVKTEYSVKWVGSVSLSCTLMKTHLCGNVAVFTDGTQKNPISNQVQEQVFLLGRVLCPS